MDKEKQEAQSLSKEDLLAKLEAGRPANLSRSPKDTNQRARRVIDAVIERTERPVLSIVLNFDRNPLDQRPITNFIAPVEVQENDTAVHTVLL